MRAALLVTIAVWSCFIPGRSLPGDSPFYPSALNTTTGLPARPGDYTPAEKCGLCHPVQYEQWKGSLHAGAFRDPLYQAVWREASQATGRRMERLCAGCHTPLGTTAEQVWIRSSGEIVIDPLAEEGVTCDFCHSVESAILLEPGGKPGNAGLLVNPTGPKRGPYFDAVSEFHETKFSFLHTQSEFCGACHNVFHPTSGAAVVRTYEEWKKSIYAQEEIHCQDCHMVPPAVAAQVARDLEKPTLKGMTSSFETYRSPFYLHTFTGANSATLRLLGNEDHAKDAEARLKAAARIELDVGDPASGDRHLEVKIRVHNIGAGHNLPTGMTEFRQMWLDVTAADAGAEARTIWRSGGLDASGRLDPAAKTYGAKAVDAQGKPTWKPWEVARIESDTSIPPKGQALETYQVPIPNDAVGPVRVSATLVYRSFPQEVADKYLQVEGYRVPLVEMASASTLVELGGR